MITDNRSNNNLNARVSHYVYDTWMNQSIKCDTLLFILVNIPVHDTPDRFTKRGWLHIKYRNLFALIHMLGVRVP